MRRYLVWGSGTVHIFLLEKKKKPRVCHQTNSTNKIENQRGIINTMPNGRVLVVIIDHFVQGYVGDLSGELHSLMLNS